MPRPRTRSLTCALISLFCLSFTFLSCRAWGGEGGVSPFAEYRACLQKGDTVEAVKLVTALSRRDTALEAEMANFLLAKRALDHGDTNGASDYLDDGTPAELWDHAAYLRATVYRAQHQDVLASQQWSRIAQDTSSVYAEEALYELALQASKWADLDSLSRILDFHNRLTLKRRRPQFDLLMAQALANQNHHHRAVERLFALAVNSPHTSEGQTASAQLASYSRDYAFRSRDQTPEELEKEFENLADHNSFAWGLERVKDECVRSGWQSRNDLLLFYKGRFENGLGKHRAAIQDLQNHRSAYPKSRFAYRALYYLGRSAYLTDQDKVAIPALTRVATEASDTVLINRALEVLGFLYMDHQRSTDAVVVLQRWADLSKGLDSHADALWRLAWALWETRDFRGARQAWTELSLLNIESEYVPASLYWSARAADQLGEVESAGFSYRALDSVFTNSYYSVIRRHISPPDSALDLPLIPPTLDDFSHSSGVHTRKFGMLATMQLSDLALKEWPAAQREQPGSPGFAWWKVQVQYWEGHRLDAWLTMRNELGQFVRTGGRRPDDFYRIAYPRDFADSITKISAEYKLDPYFVMGVICQESHFEQSIVSGAGAIGLMQLVPGTASIQARKLGLPYSTASLYTPEYNLRLGIAHLADLLKEWNGDTVLALASYNAGKNAAAGWQAKFGDRPRDEFIEKIPYRETRLFVKRITEHIAAYRRLYPDLAGQS